MLKQHLRKIAAVAPDATILRTDFRVFDSAYQGTAHIEKANKRQRLALPPHLDGKPHHGTVACIRTFFGLPQREAEEIYAAICGVIQINPRGAWCLRPDSEPERTITDNRSCRFVDDLVSSLAELLPTVSRIEADNWQQPSGRGHMQRRTFVRVLSLQGEEVAALDTAHFPKHIRSLVVEGEEHQSSNRIRSQAWALQMGADHDEMALILNDLHGLFFKAGLNYINLSDGVVG